MKQMDISIKFYVGTEIVKSSIYFVSLQIIEM